MIVTAITKVQDRSAILAPGTTFNLDDDVAAIFKRLRAVRDPTAAELARYTKDHPPAAAPLSAPAKPVVEPAAEPVAAAHEDDHPATETHD